MPAGGATARSVAFETLRRVEERGAYADAVLGTRLTRVRLSAADQALATRLVYGTLAWQGRLDWHLAQLCTSPPQRLDPWLRVILRLGLYQILFLDRVPAYAAVDTSADLAHGFRRGAATGLVNATLRRAAAESAALALPDASVDPLHACAVRWSHPVWLVARWREELGESDLESLLRADQEPAPTVVRVNPLRTNRTTLIETLRATGLPAASTTCYSPAGIRLDGPLHEAAAVIPEGLCTVQSEASQLVAYLVAPRPAERILDACAAPGGKATHLASLMHNCGEVLAVDVSEGGLAQVRQRSAALGISIIRTRRADARLLVEDAPEVSAGRLFDRVLVDAPCSGLGTLRSHPELRWRVQAGDENKLSLLQVDILRSVARLCVHGGLLVYATCTISRAENDAVIERFLSEHPNFRLEDPRPDLPASIRSLVDHQGFLRTFPHRHDIDGFFAARLRHRGSRAA